MIRLATLLNELEFDTQEEFELYSKKHNVRKDTEVIIGGRKTTAGNASSVSIPEKPICRPAPSRDSDSEKKPKLTTIVDEKIYDFISDWIMSSITDSEKRNELLSNIDHLDIPDKYKTVPSEFLYRAQKKGSSPSQTYVSYSYTIEGAKRQKSWLKKTHNLQDSELEIVKLPVTKANILLSIPTFFKATKRSSGRRFEDLWEKETEVIVNRK